MRAMTVQDDDVILRYNNKYGTKTRVFEYLDACLAKCMGSPLIAEHGALPRPKRLLLADGAHLGDTISILSLASQLKRVLPDTEIGLLTGGWNKPLLEMETVLDRVHYLDHWYIDRSKGSRIRALVRYAQRSEAAVREIQLCKYDMAVNLRPWFPNFVLVLWRARVPIRLGYARMGFTPFFTHCYPFQYSRKTFRAFLADLLACLPIDQTVLMQIAVPWIRVPVSAREGARSLLGSVRHYAVIHIGGDSPGRSWGEDGWREVASYIVDNGLVPVFTGSGAAQSAAILRITTGLSGFVDLCDKTSWSVLAAVIEGSRFVVSVDTSVAHLAAALGVHCASIHGGMVDPKMWGPLGLKAKVLTHLLPCSPCFDYRGCSHRSCIMQVTPADAKSAIREWL
jgi:ADP-heptose:LPS heptosyltransferase